MNIETSRRRPPIAVVRVGPHTSVFKRASSSDAKGSVAGVVLLFVLAVALTIVGVVLLGGILMGAWWLLSHIPLPPFMGRLLSHTNPH